MLVAIPSKGRPQGVKSLKLVGSATVFVPETEVEAYRTSGARNVVAVPAEVRGITPTRNWILDYAQRQGEDRVVMVDDDLMRAGWIQMHAANAEYHTLAEAELLCEWRKLFDLTEQLGYRLWGVATDGAPRSCYPYKPFLFQTYVTASCMGIVNRGVRFDPAFPVKEDYELCLRCIVEDGGVVGCRYMFWQNSHWRDAGGCADYRTQQMEEDCIKRLIKKYPGRVRWAPNKDSRFCIQLEF